MTAGSGNAGTPDARTLVLSVWASGAFAVLALGWGLWSGSRLIVFDGLYSAASVGLSLLAVLALRTARRGPDERYPWGREVWEPLTVVLKATALAALSLYALAGAVAEIIEGPGPVTTDAAFAYGVVATLAGLAVTVLLRRRARQGSDLVRAEAAEWAADTLLSVGVLVGFGIAVVLDATGHAELSRYVDPVMVVLVSASFLPVPARLAASGFREVLSMAPPPELLERIRAAVAEVAEAHGIAEHVVRAGKVGDRLDVEVDLVVGDGSSVRTIRDGDAVRAQLQARIAALGLAPSLAVVVTADPANAR
jgi:cation diffusion facilitator family transporter